MQSMEEVVCDLSLHQKDFRCLKSTANPILSFRLCRFLSLACPCQTQELSQCNFPIQPWSYGKKALHIGTKTILSRHHHVMQFSCLSLTGRHATCRTWWLVYKKQGKYLINGSDSFLITRNVTSQALLYIPSSFSGPWIGIFSQNLTHLNLLHP